VSAAARSLGVATVADLAAYHGMLQAEVRDALTSIELAEVRVEGWKAPAYAHPEMLERLSRRGATRSVLLSPFDSLIWYRGRVERLFGLRHRLEAYTPKAQRKYGYFAMPVLGGTTIVGLVDPGRQDKVLVAKQVTLFDPGSTEHVARALTEAASWVGCTSIALQRVEPASARADLRALVGASP
jgi:uncharacterized protein YcaQ